MTGHGTKQQYGQNVATEEFLYFFLRLRKGEIRRIVATLRERHPGETEHQLATRLIQSKERLSLFGGTLMNLSLLLPAAGPVMKMIGMVGASSMMTRMHLYLILEIALLYGKDIDDRARVPEIAAVVAATGLGLAAPLLVKVLGLHPLYALPAGALSATASTRLIGSTAIQFYSGELNKGDDQKQTYSLPATPVSSSVAPASVSQ